MKTLLDELNEKIKFELNEKAEEKKEEKKDSDKPSEDEKKDKKGRLGTKRSTRSEMTGLVKNVFSWEIEFDSLKKAINDEVRGVVVTKAQAEEIFKLIKKMLESPEEFEEE